MGARWDIAAVVVAIITVLAASPITLSLWQWLARRFITLLLPATNRCRRILWDDRPEGLMHQCQSTSSHIHNSVLQVHDSSDCFGTTLQYVFNRPSSQITSGNSGILSFTTKPDALPLFKDYIQTDLQTIKGFLILTSEDCRSCEKLDMWKLLDIRKLGSITTLHLGGTRLAIPNPALTKTEVQKFIEGYPPFYRESFTTSGGISIASPLYTPECTKKGAWILAVGLSKNIGHINSLHNMQRVTHETHEVYWKGTCVMTAFRMIGRKLDQLQAHEEETYRKHVGGSGKHPDLLPHSNGNTWVSQARECYNMIMTEEFSLKSSFEIQRDIESSALFKPIVGDCPCLQKCIGDSEHSKPCRRGQIKRKDPSRYLTEEQCTAALEIFKNYIPSEENLEIILPVLPSILQSLILGMFEVEQYFAHHGRKLELPPELVDAKYVYLRNCKDEES